MRLYKFMITDWVKLTDLQSCSNVLNTKRFNRNLQPLEIEVPDAKRILVIAPHPDDDIIGAGGTLIKAKAIGADIHVLYVTNGLPEHAEAIRKETLSVCEQIGTTPHFLDCQARAIPINDRDVNSKVQKIVTELKPDLIFTSFLLDDHDDHRRVNHLLLEVLDNKKLPKCEIWAYQIYSSVIPNVVVNISEQVTRKKELIDIWESVGKLGDLAHYILGVNASNSRYLKTKEIAWAESFFVVPIEEYLKLCRIYFRESNGKSYYFPDYS
ncbi:MAG: PIG-L family deacetylase [Candidatus Marinimicrobia bacterium]|nr:PIG-L family deacetylase [Candidatus Neomarinimicrobiota bacterium]